LTSGGWGLCHQTPTLLLPLGDIDLLKCDSRIKTILLPYFEKYTQKPQTVIIVCYVFASSALLRLFFTSNIKKDDNYLAPPEFCSLLLPCCVGLATALPPLPTPMSARPSNDINVIGPRANRKSI